MLALRKEDPLEDLVRPDEGLLAAVIETHHDASAAGLEPNHDAERLPPGWCQRTRFLATSGRSSRLAIVAAVAPWHSTRVPSSVKSE